MTFARQLALPIFAFVVAGSLALVIWVHRETLKDSRRHFAELAESNARFIREGQYPRSERTTEGLSRALGVEVRLVSASDTNRWPETGQWMALPKDREAVAAWVSPEERLVLIRPAVPSAIMEDPSRLLAALLGFWALSIALAWVLARRVVDPLRRLAARIPHIADDPPEMEIPEAKRPDEIGLLARSYRDTRAQLALEKSARLQSERLAALGRMAASLAHEINNPVAAIRLHAQLLEDEVPEEARERVQTILSEGVRIEGIVNQWMFLARPQPPQTEACDLGEIVKSVTRAVQPSADHADVKIINSVEPGLQISADKRRLAQAISNILTNAIQASGGGRVTIAASRNASVALSISDSGPGFSSGALARGAELFYSEKAGGMGVGLSVSSEIMRAHGGEIRLANNPEGGANVTLVLPDLLNHHS